MGSSNPRSTPVTLTMQSAATVANKPADVLATRPTGHEVYPLFVNRWSPRSFSATPVPQSVLDSMVEAARWAPSSINLQPWRFHITVGPGPTRDAWNAAVNPSNRAWSDKAPVLVWVVAKTTMGANPYNLPGETPNRHAFFDTGAATVQFVLEGERHGIKSHYMGGVDIEKAHKILGLVADEQVVCAIVLGFPGEASDLPQALRARERPSGRKPVGEIASFR
jgi:nitroreductase